MSNFLQAGKSLSFQEWNPVLGSHAVHAVCLAGGVKESARGVWGKGSQGLGLETPGTLLSSPLLHSWLASYRAVPFRVLQGLWTSGIETSTGKKQTTTNQTNKKPFPQIVGTS